MSSAQEDSASASTDLRNEKEGDIHAKTLSKERIKPSSTHSVLAGGCAGLASRMLVAPLDVAKIRRQLVPTSLSSSSSNSHESSFRGSRNLLPTQGDTSLYALFRHVIKTSPDGVFRALYRGNSWALGLWIGYSGIQFPVYEWTRDFGERMDFSTRNSGLLAGANASFVATIATFPLDSLRTRYVALAGTSRPTAQTFTNVYAGLGPSLIVVIPQMALVFYWHELLKTRFEMSSALAGGISGAMSRVAIYPLDTVKRRLMMHGQQGGATASTAQGALTVTRNMWRSEGVYGFYRGMSPSLLKTVVATTATFLVYDATLNALEQAAGPRA